MVLFFMSDIIVACIVAAAVGGIGVYLYLRKKGFAAAGEMSAREESPLVLGLRENAALFGQLYEAMYLVSKGKSAKIKTSFAAWNSRVDTLDEETPFVEEFRRQFGEFDGWKEKKAIKKAGKLIKAVKKAGIARDKADSVFAEDDFTDKYEITTGVVEEGEELDVLSPFWSVNDEIIEKGIAR